MPNHPQEFDLFVGQDPLPPEVHASHPQNHVHAPPHDRGTGFPKSSYQTNPRESLPPSDRSPANPHKAHSHERPSLGEKSETGNPIPPTEEKRLYDSETLNRQLSRKEWPRPRVLAEKLLIRLRNNVFGFAQSVRSENGKAEDGHNYLLKTFTKLLDHVQLLEEDKYRSLVSRETGAGQDLTVERPGGYNVGSIGQRVSSRGWFTDTVASSYRIAIAPEKCPSGAERSHNERARMIRAIAEDYFQLAIGMKEHRENEDWWVLHDVVLK